LILDQGFSLKYKSIEESPIDLNSYGEYLYDSIIIFAPSIDRLPISKNVFLI